MDPNQTFNLKNLLRKPYFIPDSKKTSELFRELQQAKAYIAIVLDEYGGTAGIVTIEDLLEEIVGNIFDEYDEIDEEIKEVGPGVFEIDGLVNIDDVEDIVKAGLPTDDYDTLSGFILGQLGRFPNKGEHVEIDYKNYRFEVLEYTDNVIEKIKITKIFDDSKEETIDED
jgi:putative hemolysin